MRHNRGEGEDSVNLIEKSKGTAILSDCCESPFGYVRNGRVTITVRHQGSEPHMLVLTPADLRNLAEKAEACGKMTREAA